MRILAILCSFWLLCGVSIGGESQEEDCYFIRVVQNALKQAPGVRVSFTEKYLHRLGDSASIALLKIMDRDKLTKAESVMATLDIIQQAFSYPHLISREIDRKPNITLFLLIHLHQDVSDAQVQSEIQQTIEFVKKKSSQ